MEEKYESNEIQATMVTVEDENGKLAISAIYSPPKHNLKTENYSKFFKSLVDRFIAGGDYNAKHAIRGSSLSNTKGRALLNSINDLKLSFASPGTATYWPTNPKKITDLTDFCVTKVIPNHHVRAGASLELPSDHSPVVVVIIKTLSAFKLPFK